jgi:Flp pilus assembly protein TadG
MFRLDRVSSEHIYETGEEMAARMRIRGREKGSAAVELALLFPVLITLLMFPIFYAKCLWHYTAAQKAAQDSARFLAAIPRQEMRSAVLVEDALNTTLRIARAELGELDPGNHPPSIEVFCGTSVCNGTGARPLPTTVRVLIKVDMYDTIFGVVDTGRYGYPITADVTQPYMGM